MADRTPTGTQQDTDRQALSVGQAAQRLGVTPDAIRAKLHRGTLAGEKVDGVWRVWLPVGRQDVQQDTDRPRQDADRQGDRPPTVPLGTQAGRETAPLQEPSSAAVPFGAADPALIAAKDETIARLGDEVAFLRQELETRTDELERRDVLLREALGRIPALGSGETIAPSEAMQIDAPKPPHVGVKPSRLTGHPPGSLESRISGVLMASGFAAGVSGGFFGASYFVLALTTTGRFLSWENAGKAAVISTILAVPLAIVAIVATIWIGRRRAS